jgi:hypothetical protein
VSVGFKGRNNTIMGLLIALRLLLGAIAEGGSTEAQPEEHDFWENWSVGVGCNERLCEPGKDLKQHTASALDPSLSLYWLHQVEGAIRYRILENYEIEIAGGYEWAALDHRRLGNNNEKWRIGTFPVHLGLKTPFFSGRRFVDFMKFRLSLCLSTCEDIEKVYETDPDEPWKHTLVGYETIKGSGLGFISSFFLGSETRLSSSVVSEVCFGVSGGGVTYDSETDITWFPVDLNMSGFFVSVNLRSGGVM